MKEIKQLGAPKLVYWMMDWCIIYMDDDEVHKDYGICSSGKEDANPAIAVRSRNHSSEGASAK